MWPDVIRRRPNFLKSCPKNSHKSSLGSKCFSKIAHQHNFNKYAKKQIFNTKNIISDRDEVHVLFKNWSNWMAPVSFRWKFFQLNSLHGFYDLYHSHNFGEDNQNGMSVLGITVEYLEMSYPTYLEVQMVI